MQIMSAVSYVIAVILLSWISASQERVLLETASLRRNETALPSTDGEDLKSPNPPALLDGSQVKGAELSPEFQANVFNYTATLSEGVTDMHIISQVSATKDNDQTKSAILESDNVDSRIQSIGSESKPKAAAMLVHHISAEKHQSVNYYLQVGHALQGHITLREFLRDALYVVGSAIAAVVVLVLLYSIYLALSSQSVSGYFFGGSQVEEYQAIAAHEPSTTSAPNLS